MKHFFVTLSVLLALAASASAQTADSLPEKRLTLGGYGEANYTRNFFSGNPFRYMNPDNYRNDPSHGRFDLPHIVFYVNYEFGNGWRMSSEIEFEHGGAESAVEIEAEESGEYESEIERGGEVAMEQFWLEKTFHPAMNLRVGHIIVPVGLTNGNHLPTQFFTVYRPEGESTIMPCTWHETGIALWGAFSGWRYEIQLLPGLDSDLFGSQAWIGNASASPYEFRIANKYATALRIDNYSIKGLRMGISGYYGQSFANSLMPTYSDKYSSVKGEVAIGSFDFEYIARRIIARGYFDYGHLNDAEAISRYNKTLSNKSPSPRTSIASDAIASGVEAGYDLLGKAQKLYLFGRYEYYDSMYKTPSSISDLAWCGRQRAVVGLNWYPMPEIVVKAEYSAGLLENPYKNENSVSLGIAYAGFFH
ncbi:MAG: hypothetical protein LBR64_10020 [Dysgonamonadaceae bacterium]|jgi:hypothetical protein|nr:hypothetical protein [Dysgonamonadaceae bacterium]